MRALIGLLLLVILLASAVPAQAQGAPCHGYVKSHITMLNVRQWPWGPPVGALWPDQGFAVWQRSTGPLGGAWLRISYGNTPDDPAIYWIAGWLVTVDNCNWEAMRDGR